MKPTNKTSMDNLSKIKAAYAMGYAAKGKLDNYIDEEIIVVSIDFEFEEIYLRTSDNMVIEREFYDLEKSFQIKNFLYMGQLGGNEPIPEGQRFRVKSGEYEGSIITFKNDFWDQIYSKEKIGGVDSVDVFFKSELEPVFN